MICIKRKALSRSRRARGTRFASLQGIVTCSNRALVNPRRLATLVATNLMDTPVEEAFDRLTRLAARLVRAPISLVSLVDDKREFFKSSYGLPAEIASRRELPIDHSFCQHVISSKSAWIVENARVDPVMRNSPTVTELGVCSYAGIPLEMPNGEVIGTFCVLNLKPRRWSAFQIGLLQDLAASVLTEIEFRMVSLKQTESMEVLTHDLKNPLSAVFLLTDHLERAATRDGHNSLAEALSRIRESSQRMRNVISSLVELNTHMVGSQAFADEPVDLREVVQDTIRETRSFEASNSRIQIDPSLALGPQAPWIVRGQRDQLTLALTNLLAAAAEMTRGQGTVGIDSCEKEELAGLRIRINLERGQPIADEEIGALFDTDLGTGAILRKGTKLGLFLAREIVALQGGELSVARLPRVRAGETLEFHLLLPKNRTDATAA